MFRTIGHIALSLLLLISTSGFTVSKHYCGGELISVSLLVEAEKCCEAGGCCQTKNETHKLEVDYSISTVLEVAETVQNVIADISIDILDDRIQKYELGLLLLAEPPPLDENNKLALNQVFLL